MLPKLYIVVPCFNEQTVLPMTSPIFLDQINKMIDKKLINENSAILFIVDGSKDSTWSIIEMLSQQNPHFKGVKLSRNRGHQNALLGGLMYAKDFCDITISIDCDGQDDVNVMTDMVSAYHKGAEIVYGVRSERTTDTVFKRFTAQSFYKLLNWMGAETIYNHADYRLVSSRALNEFSKFEEVNLYLRGLFPMVGFNSTCVYYKRQERMAGESHYPLKKMLALAFDGVTSLSVKPIRIITGVGTFISLFSFLCIIYTLISYISGHTVPGWSSVMIAVSFIGGVQLISLGVIGEYIGKIYLETKKRPRYIISETTEDIKAE